MSSKIVTRFAPSPTGFLHIGGARTALFNWLYARNQGGKYLLRIEDTDRARSTRDAIDAILDGLSWLGLDWDEEPLFQHTRADRHIEVAHSLLEQGLAYKCYATAEELQEMRETAKKEGRPVKYDGRWRDRDPSQAPNDRPPAIRLKAPQSGETIISDKVQGNVRFANDQLDDMILLRSDGTPTYMLAVVVDDYDMGVTHVIRGDDHLNNAARQVQLLTALDWPVPVYAHIPLIHGADGAKLSKRHGALGVEAYRDMGLLPEALRNYLLRLGWSHGDDEIISTAQAIEWFNLESIGKGASRFDIKKLESLNSHYLRETSDEDLLKALSVFKGWNLTPDDHDAVVAVLPLVKERAKTLVELADQVSFALDDGPYTLDDKAAKLLNDDARAAIRNIIAELEPLSDWTPDTIGETIKSHLEKCGLKLGKIGPAIRVALTGKTNAPGIFDIAAVIGKERAIKRLKSI